MKITSTHILIGILLSWIIWTELFKSGDPVVIDNSLSDYLLKENDSLIQLRLNSIALIDSIKTENDEIKKFILDDAVVVRNATEPQLDSMLQQYLSNRR